MLRFPYRQVFGDPDNQTESERFYALDQFKAKVALTDVEEHGHDQPGEGEPMSTSASPSCEGA